MADFVGSIDEVAAYGAALTPDLLKHHYLTAEGTWGNYDSVVLRDHPVGYWQLNEHGGQATDVSGNNNNGVYTGNAAFRIQGALNTNVFNQISVFLREFPLDPVTQLDLNSSGTAWTNQGQLEALGHQPNYGPAAFLPREQRDIDILTMADLDLQMQGQLERIKDTLTEDWIEVRFQWASYTSTLTITNRPQDLIYEFTDIGITASKDHILIPTLSDTSLRVQIYQLDESGNIRWDQQVFDTTEINDPSLIRRRRGRVGTNYQLIDGDANVQNFRARGLSYGEVYSQKFQSLTPVSGASLFASSTPNRELFRGWDPGPFGGLIDVDASKSNSGQAFKVTNLGQFPLQGIQSTPVYIDEWAEIEIFFDLWVSQAQIANNQQLSAFLLGEQGRIIPLNLGRVAPDHWQSITMQLGSLNTYQTGSYRFVLLHTMITDPHVWFIDNMSVQQRAVAWYARSRDDYWYGRWQDFRNTVNSIGGMLFPHEGTNLQFKGKALRHNSQISEIQTEPKYSQPGRFVWSDEDIIFHQPPVASFNTKIDYNLVTFSGYASHDSGGHIISWDWTFGDGLADSGPVVDHLYAIDGTYTVTLTVTDEEGNQSQTTGTVTVAHTFQTSAFWRASSNMQATPYFVGQVISGSGSPWDATSSWSAAGTTGSIRSGAVSWHGASTLVLNATDAPPPVSGPTLGGRGTFIWQIDANYPNMHTARMNYVIIKAQDGTSRFNSGVLGDWISHARGEGLRVAIWGYIYGSDPIGEANLAADLVNQYGVDAYVADAESEYESNPNPVSAQFCDQFRSRLPDFEAGLSSFGRPSFHTGLNWATWAQHGFIGMPQAYYNDSNALDVPDCINDWHNFGFNRVYVTVPCYTGALGRPSSAAIASSVTGQLGWSTWRADTMILSDFQALGNV